MTFDPNAQVVFSHFEIAVFDGPAGTGRQLGHWTLASTDASAAGDPTGGLFGDWRRFDGQFARIGHSVVWSEPDNLAAAAFDNLEFRLAAPTPEPSSIYLCAPVFAAWILWRGRSRAKGAYSPT